MTLGQMGDLNVNKICHRSRMAADAVEIYLSEID